MKNYRSVFYKEITFTMLVLFTMMSCQLSGKKKMKKNEDSEIQEFTKYIKFKYKINPDIIKILNEFFLGENYDIKALNDEFAIGLKNEFEVDLEDFEFFNVLKKKFEDIDIPELYECMKTELNSGEYKKLKDYKDIYKDFHKLMLISLQNYTKDSITPPTEDSDSDSILNRYPSENKEYEENYNKIETYKYYDFSCNHLLKDSLTFDSEYDYLDLIKNVLVLCKDYERIFDLVDCLLKFRLIKSENFNIENNYSQSPLIKLQLFPSKKILIIKEKFIKNQLKNKIVNLPKIDIYLYYKNHDILVFIPEIEQSFPLTHMDDYYIREIVSKLYKPLIIIFPDSIFKSTIFLKNECKFFAKGPKFKIIKSQNYIEFKNPEKNFKNNSFWRFKKEGKNYIVQNFGKYYKIDFKNIENINKVTRNCLFNSNLVKYIPDLCVYYPEKFLEFKSRFTDDQYDFILKKWFPNLIQDIKTIIKSYSAL